MNNWIVITGAFSSGKTTLLEALAHLGYRTVPEMARLVIDEGLAKGLTVAQIREDEEAFQYQVLERKVAMERLLDPGELTFFDRGIPDSTAYLQFGGFDDVESRTVSQAGVYRRVFILDPLPFQSDYARTEQAAQAVEIDRLLEQAYEELEYEVVRVPVRPVAERLQMILAHIAP